MARIFESRGSHNSLTHLLIDALSVNNLSGRHVLLGHLNQVIRRLAPAWRFTLLLSSANSDIANEAPSGVDKVIAAASAAWTSRALWSFRSMERLCTEREVDVVFSPSGMLSASCSRPQVVLAQNPWPLMRMAVGSDRVRTMLQRRGFAAAQRRARTMVFNSHYMKNLYSHSFGPPTNAASVAYQGIADSCFDVGSHAPMDVTIRSPTVLCVSVMARHKAIEALVDAFAQIAAGIAAAQLVLIGAWPDPRYRREVLEKIDQLNLASRVLLLGHVDNAELKRHYASARVFCLLSRCESFGIPAVEAQAFATPTVVSTGTAAPEIAGPGGTVVPSGDCAAAAEALASLLVDDHAWAAASLRARANAERFRWVNCSVPLVDALERAATVPAP